MTVDPLGLTETDRAWITLAILGAHTAQADDDIDGAAMILSDLWNTWGWVAVNREVWALASLLIHETADTAGITPNEVVTRLRAPLLVFIAQEPM